MAGSCVESSDDYCSAESNKADLYSYSLIDYQILLLRNTCRAQVHNQMSTLFQLIIVATETQDDASQGLRSLHE